MAPEDKINNEKDIDSITCAEIPDKDLYPQAYLTVTSCMLHGPCGKAFPKSPCMVDGICTKKFPKAFAEKTILTEDSYPIYKRRDDGKYIEKNGIKLTNQWIVPYNLYLSTKYNAHINVEISNSIGAVKYLFKYVYKGSDKVEFSLQAPNEEQKQSNEQDKEPIDKDEIKEFQEARFVSASEACHRIFQFKTHDQFPHTQRLPVHLENQEQINFKESDDLKKK